MKKGILIVLLAFVFFLIGYSQKISNLEKKVTIEAGDEIVLKTGSSSITMKKDGTIIISGKDITISGSDKVDFKASKDIIMKGKKIVQN